MREKRAPVINTLCIKNIMNINLTSDYIILSLLVLIAPTIVLVWSIYTKKSNKQTIGYTLLSAIIIGGILQTTDEGHPHVPGSEVFLFSVEVVFTVIVLIIVLGIRYVYEKVKNT